MDHAFKFSNELTFDTVQANHKRLLNRLRDSKIKTLHLDMREVSQCDSAGLALLIEAQRLCKQYNKSLKIEGVSKEIDALAEFCGIRMLLHMQAHEFKSWEKQCG